MIKKLRIKLIAASMISLLVVLLVIEGIVGILNYRKMVGDADRILDVLEENSGRFPHEFPMDMKDGRRFMSPEIPYESRYFSVLLNEQGNVIFTDTQKTVTVDFTDAQEYAREVWEKQSERGFLHEYRYLCCSYKGETRIMFLDCRRQLDTFQNFLVTAASVSVIGLLSVFVLLIYLSSRIVKPFSATRSHQNPFPKPLCLHL